MLVIRARPHDDRRHIAKLDTGLFKVGPYCQWSLYPEIEFDRRVEFDYVAAGRELLIGKLLCACENFPRSIPNMSENDIRKHECRCLDRHSRINRKRKLVDIGWRERD